MSDVHSGRSIRSFQDVTVRVFTTACLPRHLHVTVTIACPLNSNARSRDCRGPCARLPPALKGEERMSDERGEASSQQPTDSAHDITQYRLDRRDIVGIAPLLTHIILATVSIPLAGRPTAPTRPHLSTAYVLLPRPRHAHHPHPSLHRQPSDDFDEVED